MNTLNLISLYPEHPLLSWKDSLFNNIPMHELWWDEWYNYLDTHTKDPKEIGFTLARTFDLISKNAAPELILNFPNKLQFQTEKLNSILEGIYRYRTRLGHIKNRNLPPLTDFKIKHWNLILSYVSSVHDYAYKILMWAWSTNFWVPDAFNSSIDTPYRYLLGALLLKDNDDTFDLLETIKLYWTNNNLLLPRNHDFLTHQVSIKRIAWFKFFFPEYAHIVPYLFEMSAIMTISQLAELLQHYTCSDSGTEHIDIFIT